ncbi:hypothetical protein HOLleu_29721 [Holothuria leucospilota]|uniref:Uncharacterized protein n=1 Tax=Holothuria leucospilota TaxID=206669 RepID=A0A9Q1BJF9_HOLLE|nr:hypothetical protein HOLleu_29721 [Holothuria leucospilota]
MYLKDKIFFLKEALEADMLTPVRRELWFRRHKGILMDAKSYDFEEPAFLKDVLEFRGKCTLLISQLGKEEGLKWPNSSVIPGLERLVFKIDDCLNARWNNVNSLNPELGRADVIHWPASTVWGWLEPARYP